MVRQTEDEIEDENYRYDKWLEEELLFKGDAIGTAVPVTVENIYDMKFPEDVWHVEGLIPKNGITVLSATPGSFKTWLLLEIAISTAQGKSLFGHFDTKETAVLMVDEENSYMLLNQRLKLLGAGRDLAIWFQVMQNYKLTDRLVDDLIEFCTLTKIGLVTFDSLVRIHNSQENDAGDMAEVFRQLRKITEAGITVLLTHHNRKPSGNPSNLSHEMRGSSDILAAIDCHLALVREDDKHLVLKQTKNRLSEEMQPIELVISASENKVEIKYAGNLEPTQSKKELLRELILEILEKQNKLNQRQIKLCLQKLDHNVNMRTLRDALELLEFEKSIVKAQGKRNAFEYSLNKDEA